MERTIIHSDLKKKEIQPQALLEQYLVLLNNDVQKMLSVESLQPATCPVTGEREVRGSFQKMDMQYQVSQTLRNIYLSPCPSMNVLRKFYSWSPAREFWLTELWPQTKDMREEKIIFPQLEWAQGFVSQYCRNSKLFMAEFLPNHWGYYRSARNVWPKAKYQLIDPLFNPNIAREEISTVDLNDNITSITFDAVFLFEAMDRSPDPLSVLKKVANALKPGGLCFITCLLSSGFEIQVLGQESEVFVPPERMNLLSYEGMNTLIKKESSFEVLEFSTPGVLDIPNVTKQLDQVNNIDFFQYILKQRQDEEMVSSFQDFLQLNRLGTFGRLVLRKK